MREIQARPGSRYEYAFGANHYDHIEYLKEVSKPVDDAGANTHKNKRMILLHQVMSRLLQQRGTPSTKYEAVGGNYQTWKFDPY